MAEHEKTLALYIDFENIALGFENRKKKFDIQKVLERLVEKGKIIVKRAYADWARYADLKRDLHEAAIELIEIPKRSRVGKNSADIRLCVDAMDLSYSKEHIDTFVIMSGDSDFSPLVSKLKENGKHVIGVSLKDSASNLLISNCDEFIFYEDLDSPLGTPPGIGNNIPEEKRAAFQLLIDSVVALMRENKEILYSSMIKETMKRKKPSFAESAYGYRTFSDLLKDAKHRGLVETEHDPRSRTLIVTGFGKNTGSSDDSGESKRRDGGRNSR